MEDEHGCSVWRVVRKAEVWRTIDEDDKTSNCMGIKYEVGDLISVDLVRSSTSPGGADVGPFLRLTDGTGWLYECKNSVRYTEKLPVENGHWEFYADNVPIGISLRRHPFDGSPHVEPPSKYEPMEKISCDRKVACSPSGVNAYRVKGTEGWVFDKRLGGLDRDDVTFMVRPADAVQMGEFAYEAQCLVDVRSRTNIGDDCRTKKSIQKGELIFCDVIRESPYRHGNGPFVRLTDGSGWLFERKENEPVLLNIFIEVGVWTFEVLASEGLAPRSQPNYEGSVMEQTFFPEKQHVICDRKVMSSRGIPFYRVQGTIGWVFEKHAEKDVLRLVSDSSTAHTASSEDEPQLAGWSIDIKRGAAAVVDGLKESMLCSNPEIPASP
mmetsp:Transcript_45622/g.138639  ORF Transcript_45622/g.138639 Transcript_45622/m.138639 type:complete len:381 (-) Transcript_45622:203-1345(-)